MANKPGIYVLQDPFTHEIRYVGMSSVSVRTRILHHLQPHMTTKKNTKHLPIYKWIKSLNGTKPVPVVVQLFETIKLNDLQQCEQYWISYFKSNGSRLLNCTEGGEGLFNPSDEVRQKMSKSAMGKYVSPETKEKISKSKIGNQIWLGRHHSEESKIKISTFWQSAPIDVIINRIQKIKETNTGNQYFLGKKHSDYTKQLISKKLSGTNSPWHGKRHTDETIQKMRNSSTSKKQIIDHLGNIYPSISEAGRKLGISPKLIDKVLHNRIKKTHGYVFSYYSKENVVCP